MATSKDFDTKSQVSSRASVRSNVSSASAAAKARAKAEAARVRASFAEKEAKLKVELAERESKLKLKQAEREAQAALDKAKLDAELETLAHQCEAEAASRQADILEAAEEEVRAPDNAHGSRRSLRSEIEDRINAYVREQNELHQSSHHDDHAPPGSQANETLVSWGTPTGSPAVGPSPQNAVSPKAPTQHQAVTSSIPPLPAKTERNEGESRSKPLLYNMARSAQAYSSLRHTYHNTTPSAQFYSPHRPTGRNVTHSAQQHTSQTNHHTYHKVDPSAQPYVPHQHSNPADQQKTPGMTDFVKYLARRELVTTGLTQFDDRPESFRAWQSSFHNAIRGLGLSASEELDLLTKWLGKESSCHVRTVRQVHVNDPNAALSNAWSRLIKLYAAPEVLEKALFKKLDAFPKIASKDYVKLRELGDLLMEFLSAKEDGYLPGLAFLDTSRGISPIVEKLPHALQEKWITRGSRFKDEYDGCFPPFSFFADFVYYEAETRNDPSFAIPNSSGPPVKDKTGYRSGKVPVSVHKTDVTAETESDVSSKQAENPGKNCPIHHKPHPLKKCRGFRAKTLEERKLFLRENGICYRCCASTSHLAKECKVTLKCSECESDRHISAMHAGPAPQTPKVPAPSSTSEEKEDGELSSVPTVTSRCTEICGEGQPPMSCSKICLVRVFPNGQRDKAINMYAVHDDQSNRSLVRPEFFDLFDVKSSSSLYSLRTCAGTMEMSGRKAEGFEIESVNGGVTLTLPPLIECDQVPTNRSEIPTPKVALLHPHLRSVAKHIPELDPNAPILLLLGRDIIRAHKVRQQINGPHDSPFAQRLDLGWTIVGEVCLRQGHKPKVSTFKTHVLEKGRPSFLSPCNNFIDLKEKVCHGGEQPRGLANTCKSSAERITEHSLGQNLFQTTENDNKVAQSIEDVAFLKIMDLEVYRDDKNNWVAPLPFKVPRRRLPNNRKQALNRLNSLCQTLNRKPVMKQQFLDFMRKVFEDDHAEPAPPLIQDEECWYLPTFGVYHPRKPDQIRVVFDSSAQEGGVSLNNVLLTGPDLNNSLLGVLIRFRKEQVAIMADIQKMFYCFLVREDHRNFLRFLWFRDNDPTKDIIEYRMKVHVFGNSPSPSIAIYGLRLAAKEGEREHGADTQRFIERHFYVDDGLMSLPSDTEAISLLKRTQASLAESNLRLHKIVSNSPAVMKAFPPEDHAVSVQDLDLSEESTVLQRSLGLCWEIASDAFTFQVSVGDKPFTRRGVLSTINSVFDPLGLASPVTVQGRALLRELTSDTSDWDAPLPEEKRSEWVTWRDSLLELKELHIPRTYTPDSLTKARRLELCVFSDASTKAIGAVAYLRAIDEDGNSHVGFVLGKAKLAPQCKPTIPRLELCGAVLAVEMAELILGEIDLKMDAVKFYCDSKVVLGYIHNEVKRFYVYVHNRVQRIRQSTKPEQWLYVPTEHNPADHASRGVSASNLAKTTWFSGPAFLQRPYNGLQEESEAFELISPELDVEVRPEVSSFRTQVQAQCLTTDRFKRFSTWDSLVRAVALLIHIVRCRKSKDYAKGCKSCWHWCKQPRTPDERSQAMNVVIQAVQREAFPAEFSALTNGKALPSNSPLFKLSPVVVEGLMRIGGRLTHAPLEHAEKKPLVLPKRNHISALLVSYHHKQVKHQGRHFTEGAVRSSGLWIIGCKRLVSSIIHGCVTCRKLRGKMEEQTMADLPPERLSTSPPFSYVGLDVFGPWKVTARRTRGGHAESKRWAILFTCMSTRAVHIEVIESMDTSCCINALRRFFAIRGPAKQLRSDCGTNFIAASKELKLTKQQQGPSIQRYLSDQGCSWEFNPPYSSHMGGSWERMIGVARRIFDSILLQEHVHLSHEVLCTFMCEVSAIINARPLTPVSTDPDAPFPLTPTTLLTQKGAVPPPPGNFSDKDLHQSQWRQVQALASTFWTRWRREYLPTLQSRRKWVGAHRNLQQGDVVLLKDSQAARNEWPLALVTTTYPSQDGKVRKVEVKTAAQGIPKTFLRPVSAVLLLLPKED